MSTSIGLECSLFQHSRSSSLCYSPLLHHKDKEFSYAQCTQHSANLSECPILLLSTRTRNMHTKYPSPSAAFSADVHCSASSAPQAQNIVNSCSLQYSSCESCLSALSQNESGPVSSGSLSSAPGATTYCKGDC